MTDNILLGLGQRRREGGPGTWRGDTRQCSEIWGTRAWRGGWSRWGHRRRPCRVWRGHRRRGCPRWSRQYLDTWHERLAAERGHSVSICYLMASYLRLIPAKGLTAGPGKVKMECQWQMFSVCTIWSPVTPPDGACWGWTWAPWEQTLSHEMLVIMIQGKCVSKELPASGKIGF